MLPYGADPAVAVLIIFVAFVVIFLACICLKWHVPGEECTCSYQESMSETERSEKLGARKKEKYKKEKVKEPRPRKRTTDERESVSPIKDLEMLELSSSEDESEEDSLSPSEEEDLEEAAARYEADRYDPGLTRRVEATAPPPYRGHECICILRTRSLPTAVLWQSGPPLWVHPQASPAKTVEYYPTAVADLASKGIKMAVTHFGIYPKRLIVPYTAQYLVLP